MQAAPDTKSYRTDEVLKRIMADEKLRNFAVNKEVAGPRPGGRTRPVRPLWHV